MAKKKKGGSKKGGGKKGGGKKGGSKKAKESTGSKKKGPTEKELFEMQVEKLREELQAAVERLGQRNEDLASARGVLGRQVDSKESCVAHLQRVLKKEFEHRLEIQDRLQTERDLAELVEDRALGKFAASERSGDAARSHFLQQKMELEGKLSLLEELRLERNSQRAHLRRAEASLEERASALRAKGRKEDSRQADRLLRNREEFMHMCSATRVDWRSAFDLRLPVHARRQLEENVRLRCECEDATEALLSQQGRNRALGARRKGVDLEEEIQASAERYADGRRATQRERIRLLEQAQQSPIQEDGEGLREMFLEEVVRKVSAPGGTTRRLQSLGEGAVALRTETIRSLEIERCRLVDRCEEMSAILGDQERYRTSLERRVEENVDRNAAMMSAVLRAGRIFRTRCGKLGEAGELDYEVLQQMKMLLDLCA